MEQFLGVEQSYFSPNIMVHFYSKFLRRPYSADDVQRATETAAAALDVVEKNLERGPYLAGETFSLADIAWMPYLRITQTTGNSALLQTRTRVNDWATRLLSRASFR
jgi:glutathione S-transferase